jgi:hypothetical protein
VSVLGELVVSVSVYCEVDIILVFQISSPSSSPKLDLMILGFSVLQLKLYHFRLLLDPYILLHALYH